MIDHTKRANICFDCQNAVPNNEGRGCPWSTKFEPVPGWTAEQAVLNPGKKYEEIQTYRITACPLFKPDDPERLNAQTTHPIKVRCMETGTVYESLTAAAQAVGGYSADISHALKTGRRNACGYHWEAVKEEDKHEKKHDPRRAETPALEHRLHRSVGTGTGSGNRENGVVVSTLERLNYAEMKLDEAIRNSSTEDIIYWRGYRDAVTIVVRKEGLK